MAGSNALKIALVSMHTTPFASPGSGDIGGMNVVVQHTAHALADAGHRVEVFTRRTDDTSPPTSEPLTGVRLHQLKAGPFRVLTKAEQENYIGAFTIELKDQLERALSDGQGWSVIHSQHWFSGVAAIDLAFEHGIPHIQSFHSIAATNGNDWSKGEQPEGPGRVPGEARLAKESDAIIAVSEAEADTVANLGASAQRVHVVPPGVDHDVFHPAYTHTSKAMETPCRDNPFHFQDRDFILAAARLEPLKGLDLAIDLLGLIPPARRPRLIISGAPTGGFTGYDHILHRQAERLGLRNDVWFAGPLGREDLAEAMRRAAAVIIPSHSETYGLVALEAAACGVPVIASRSGGLEDAVIDGVTGVLVDDREPDTWAGVVTRVIEDCDLRTRMGRSGWLHATSHTWSATAAGWVETYRKLLDTS